MNILFSKPCHVVGRPVFDHLPLEEINAYFPSNPPTDLIAMYRYYGRGTLCDMFQFGLFFKVVAMNSWRALYLNEALDTEVCELVQTDMRLGIGYGRSGRYYLLDYDDNTFSTSLKFEDILIDAACHRGFGGGVNFPFFTTANARRDCFFVNLGQHFVEQVCKAEISGLAIRYYFNYLGTHTFFFDKRDHFVAMILTGKDLESQDESMLTIFSDKRIEGVVTHVFDLLSKISEGKFSVVSTHV